MRISKTMRWTAPLLVALAASPLSAKFPPVSEFADPAYQALTSEQAIAACDQYASHPLDPMKPDTVKGVMNDADMDVMSAYLYCFKAFQADNKNPRIRFQWARANQMHNPRSSSHPRRWYALAYRDGSEIAGAYLAKLPPEQRMSLDEMIEKMDAMRGRQGPPRPMTGQERDQLLFGSIFVIYSVAMLRVLTGEAEWGGGDCGSGYRLNAYTHEITCDGLVVGTF